MTPSEKGRHYSVCDKVVVDFTKSSREEIETTFLQQVDQKVCGRFRTTNIVHEKETYAVIGAVAYLSKEIKNARNPGMRIPTNYRRN